MQTDFVNKVSILGSLHSNYQDDEGMQDFMEFNDIGLPLAYLVSEKLATMTDEGARFVEETFDLLLDSLGIEDVGFEFLDEILAMASYGS